MVEEEDQQNVGIRSKQFYMLLLLSGMIGVVGALLTLAFFLALRYGTVFVWELIPQLFGVEEGVDSAFFIILAGLTGGFIIGLITYITQVKPKLLAEEMDEVTEKGRITPRNGMVGMARGLVGLLFGVSLGPEGPLTGGNDAMGTRGPAGLDTAYLILIPFGQCAMMKSLTKLKSSSSA